ncbi:MAG TPA: universal stress protein [Candidatus Limnocylindria bacterium]
MRLMLAYDGSACADAARDLVSRLPLPAGSAITVVTALERGPQLFGAPEFAIVPHDAEDAEGQLLADLQQMLHEAAEPLRTADRHVDTRVIRGRPASAIVDEASALQPDLLVVGSRGHGPLASVVMGSVSAEVVDHAPCPVLVARHPSVSGLVVGADGSTSADRALAALRRWPIFAGRPATVVTVAESAAGWTGRVSTAMYPAWVDLHAAGADRREQLTRIAERGAEELAMAGLRTSVDVRQGDPAEQLIRAAEAAGADLIVVGSRGLSTLPRLVIGSVARKVLMHAPQSVLVVREAKERVAAREPIRVPTGAVLALA